MAQRVFFVNKLRPGVDPEEYEAWVREVDYPIARAQGAILAYTVTRIDGTLSGDGSSPFTHLEVIDITDIEAYRALGARPDFQELISEWSQFVEEAVMVHGTVID
jgi:hypothetical protein